MKVIKHPLWSGATPWIISVLLLSLPSMIFVIIHATNPAGRLPDFFDFVVGMTMFLTGMFGFLLTFAACVTCVTATFQKHIPRSAKVTMWAFVSLSFLACLYLAQVPL